MYFNGILSRSQTDLAAPPGYSADKLALDVTSKEQDGKLVVKKAWDVALAPLKQVADEILQILCVYSAVIHFVLICACFFPQVPMNMFVMWMSGNSISIFPIMMVGMMFMRPIQALMSAGQAFKAIEGDQAPLQKLVWLLGEALSGFVSSYEFIADVTTL